MILATILYPIMGRLVILFSAPFVISILLLIKLDSRKTIYTVTTLLFGISVLWIISYMRNGAGLLSIVPGLVTFAIGIIGVLTAVSIRRFID